MLTVDSGGGGVGVVVQQQFPQGPSLPHLVAQYSINTIMYKIIQYLLLERKGKVCKTKIRLLSDIGYLRVPLRSRYIVKSYWLSLRCYIISIVCGDDNYCYDIILGK